MQRVRAECGDIGEFRLADRDVVLLTGAEANEAFFRASGRRARPGGGLPVHDPDLRRGRRLRRHPRGAAARCCTTSRCATSSCAATRRRSTAEIERMVADWDDEGEIDLLDWFAELSIYTSVVVPDRQAVPRGARRVVSPTLPRPRAGHRRHRVRRSLRRHRELPPPRRGPRRARRAHRRDHRRAPSGAGPGRGRGPGPARRADVDHDDEGRPSSTPTYITGMFISMMFAGHHTTSRTASWTLIELLRNPDVMAATSSPSSTTSYARRRRVDHLPGAARDPAGSRRRIKETLRLHPPLILLLRVAQAPIEVAGVTRSRRASSWARRPRCRTGSPRLRRARPLRPVALPRAAPGRPATTRGTGSPSAPAGTAASAPRSP